MGDGGWGEGRHGIMNAILSYQTLPPRDFFVPNICGPALPTDENMKKKINDLICQRSYPDFVRRLLTSGM